MRGPSLLTAALIVLGVSRIAHAEGATRPLRWEPAWGRFGAADLAVTTTFGVTGMVTSLTPTAPTARRSGHILFDEAVHEALQADSDSFRPIARASSDVLVAGLLVTPFALDAIGLAGIRHRSPEVALQMALIDAEAMAIVVGIHGVTSVAVARERPYGDECGARLDARSSECAENGRRYRSFFSSHTAHAFNSAGLICSHHMHLRLFGAGPADAVTCASAMVAATAVGAFRIGGDMHWASDVVVGAGVGLLVGVGIPLLHYHGGIPTLELARRGHDGTHVSLAPTPSGVALSGIF